MPAKPVIALGADHRGYALKEFLKERLVTLGYQVVDMGTHSPESTHYPLYARKVAEAVARGEARFGILICFTGIGMSIAANKVRGVRAALVWRKELAELTRRHNNANVLCLSGGFLPRERAWQYVQIFLNTPFEGGRHQKRLDLVAEIEDSQCPD